LLPHDQETAAALLHALELEKVLYELRYELGHRPDWVEIPARDLLRETP
jgi:predicted trehalose synthase